MAFSNAGQWEFSFRFLFAFCLTWRLSVISNFFGEWEDGMKELNS